MTNKKDRFKVEGWLIGDGAGLRYQIFAYAGKHYITKEFFSSRWESLKYARDLRKALRFVQYGERKGKR